MLHLDIENLQAKNISDTIFEYIHCDRTDGKGLLFLNISSDHGCCIDIEGFKYLTHLEYLDMSGVFVKSCTDKIFEKMTELQYLNISYCSGISISCGAFKNISLLKTLKMNSFNQNQNMNKMFAYLGKLEHLEMMECDQDGLLVDGVFDNLTQLKVLKLFKQDSIRNEMFHALENLVELEIMDCMNDYITDDLFKNMKKLKKLTMTGFSPMTKQHDLQTHKNKLTGHMFTYLPELIDLSIPFLNNEKIDSSSFKPLNKLQTLNMMGCCQETLGDEMFQYLPRLQELNVSFCDQESFTQNAFQSLTHLKRLNITSFKPHTISGNYIQCLNGLEELVMGDTNNSNQKQTIIENCDAFKNMTKLKKLNLYGYNQPGLNDDSFQNLKELRYLDIQCIENPNITPALLNHLPKLQYFCFDSTNFHLPYHTDQRSSTSIEWFYEQKLSFYYSKNELLVKQIFPKLKSFVDCFLWCCKYQYYQYKQEDFLFYRFLLIDPDDSDQSESEDFDQVESYLENDQRRGDEQDEDSYGDENSNSEDDDYVHGLLVFDLKEWLYSLKRSSECKPFWDWMEILGTTKKHHLDPKTMSMLMTF